MLHEFGVTNLVQLPQPSNAAEWLKQGKQNKFMHEDPADWLPVAVAKQNLQVDPADWLPVAIDLAKQNLLDSQLQFAKYVDLNDQFAKVMQYVSEAQNMLDVPKAGIKQTAKAYEKMWLARKLVAGTSQEKTIKNTTLAVRELFTLQCLGRCGLDDGKAFGALIVDAFERPLGPELISQLYLSRTSIIRVGRDRSSFQRNIVKIFGRPVDPKHLDNLFVVYSGVRRPTRSASPMSVSVPELEQYPAHLHKYFG